MTKADKIRHAATVVDSLEDLESIQRSLDSKTLVHIAFKASNNPSPVSFNLQDLMGLDMVGDLCQGLNLASKMYQDYILNYLKALKLQRKKEINEIL